MAITKASLIDLNGQELILDADADTSITADTDDRLDFKTGGTDRVHIASTGLLINNTAYGANGTLVLQQTADSKGIAIVDSAEANTFFLENDGTINKIRNNASVPIAFETASTERMRIDSSGHVGIGTSSPATGLSLVGADNTTSTLTLTNTAPSPDNTWTFTPQYNSGDLTISDDGTEIMRINTSGNLLIGRTTDAWNTDGIVLADAPFCYIERTDGSGILYLHRRGTDGVFIQFWHANAYDGYISSSSGVVSLTGFQGSHSSSGDGISADTEIGTVVSTIDEEHSQRHAKIKVSDSVGDKRVYGTLEKWNPETIEENGQTIEAHALVASTGVGSVRVTGACEGGDLLESNGDGTAKVQSDDIVRSKTIGKVTIGNSNTGVKLVSCVLYCG